jgi:hypothetical protein
MMTCEPCYRPPASLEKEGKATDSSQPPSITDYSYFEGDGISGRRTAAEEEDLLLVRAPM